MNNFELIIVDDASDDDTVSCLSDISAADNRIVLLRNERPMGAPAARNRAIKAATAEFVTGLDDDDCFHPERLSSLYEYWNLIDRQNIKTAGIYSQENWLVDGKITSSTKKPSCTSHIDLTYSNGIGNQIFSPKKYYTDAGIFDEIMPAWQDLELFIRMTKLYGPARLFDAPLYDFDVTPGVDRISSKEPRIRSALKIICDKHFSENETARRQLMLQLFGPYYNFKLKNADFLELYKLGVKPLQLAKIIKNQLTRQK